MSQFNPFTIAGPTGAVALTSGVTASKVGQSILLNASAAGTVTLTFIDGSTMDVDLQVGDNVYAGQFTKATVGTATVPRMYNQLAANT